MPPPPCAPPQALRVPREIIFLNGAPGSGKGINTPHILQTRGIDASICVSSLLVRAACCPLICRLLPAFCNDA